MGQPSSNAVRVALIASLVLAAIGCGLDSKGGVEPTGGAAGTGAGALGGSGGTGASGGFPSGGSGNAAGAEDCSNTLDDDGNGKTDCADPACSPAYSCADAAPEGWNGPVAFASDPKDPPSCAASGGYTTEAALGGAVTTPAASCPSCKCNAAGVACGAATVDVWDSSDCTGTPTSKSGTTCLGFSSLGYEASSGKISFGASTGACTAETVGSASIPAPSIAMTDRVCSGAPLGGGCPGTQVCAKVPPAPFSLCLWVPGQPSCPAEYPKATVLTTKVTDQRSCEPCGCGAPSPCAMTALEKDLPECTDTLVGVLLSQDGVCVPFAQSAFGFALTPAGGGSCAPSGGTPGGAVVEEVVTVCCK